MNHLATIPEVRVYIPQGITACKALDYLSTKGLPPHCEWRYPRRGRFFGQHLVDFGVIRSPRRMLDILSEQDVPDWFLASQKWEDFLAIGTWRTVWEPNGFEMNWHLCANTLDGHILRVEARSDNIRLSLESNKEMAAKNGMDVQVQPIALALSQCIVFVNSAPEKMMDCFEKYLSFVNGAIDRPEPFLEAVSRLDRTAGQSGSMWYLLVGDYLHQDEY